MSLREFLAQKLCLAVQGALTGLEGSAELAAHSYFAAYSQLLLLQVWSDFVQIKRVRLFWLSASLCQVIVKPVDLTHQSSFDVVSEILSAVQDHQRFSYA